MPPGGTRFAVARGLGSAAAALSRLTGSGGGTTIGGRVMLAVDPFALRRAAAGRRLILVSGTNGKSTTRTLLTAALRTRGAVVSNEGGANMPAGLTAALAADPNAGVGVLEVDEPYLPAVITATRPAAVVLLNISRDQLDRYAEVRRLAGGWREALGRPSAPHVIANADDPLIAWAAGTARSVTWVSVGLRWRADATVCPACGGLIHFGPADWRCDCGWRRPQPQWRLEEDVLLDQAGRRHPIVLQLPGAVNRGNAAMAAAAAATLGVSVPSALVAMAAVDGVDGRYARRRYAGRAVRLLLAKNPAGWQEALTMVAPQPAGLVVAVNAHVADGADPAWLWDVPFEQLRGRRVIATGERCTDVAVRLRYADVEHLQVRDWRDALQAFPTGHPVEAMANYTAFQALRRVLDQA